MIFCNIAKPREIAYLKKNFFIDNNKIIKILKRDIDGLEDNSKNELKKLIKKWVKKIEVTNDFITVHFYSEDFFPPKMVARTHYCFCLRLNLHDFISRR